jgi:methylated-DNA-protein-cysteine methyltransferase-like protein
MNSQEMQRAILLVVSRIPAGKVASYGQIAELAGLPGKARLVGRTMSHLPAQSDIPWHRVVNAAGKISLPERSGGFERQKSRLLAEGIELSGSRISLAKYRW